MCIYVHECIYMSVICEVLSLILPVEINLFCRCFVLIRVYSAVDLIYTVVPAYLQHLRSADTSPLKDKF